MAKLSVLSFKQIIPLKGSRASGQPSPLTHKHTQTHTCTHIHTHIHTHTHSFTLSCSPSEDSIADLTYPVLIIYTGRRLLSCGKRVFSLACSLSQNAIGNHTGFDSKSESGLCCSAHQCSLAPPLGPALMLFRLREVQEWEDLRALSYETLSLLNILRGEQSPAMGVPAPFINVLRSFVYIQRDNKLVFIKHPSRNSAAAHTKILYVEHLRPRQVS